MTEEIRSTDPSIDGTNLTINPEIKFRRKRIVSEQCQKTKRIHTSEFINACRFLADDIVKPFPLSAQHAQILSLVRNNKPVPRNYESAINNNAEVVLKAANLLPKQIKEKYSAVTNAIKSLAEEKINDKEQFESRLKDLLSNKQDIAQTTTNSIKDSAIKINISNIKKGEKRMANKSRNREYDEQTKQHFKQYLYYRLGEANMPDATSVLKLQFNKNLNCYLNNQKSFCNKYFREIMDECPDIIGKLLYAKQVKQGLVKGSNIKVAQPKEMPQTISTIKITKNSDMPKTLDAFKSFIETLKFAGLSEITFKF